MDYQAQVYALFRSLQQVANIQVDLIDEDELTAKGLAPFKALILTEPDIPSAGQSAVAQWMTAGGNLLTVSGAATGDRYNRPATVISSATGILEAPPRQMLLRDQHVQLHLRLGVRGARDAAVPCTLRAHGVVPVAVVARAVEQARAALEVPREPSGAALLVLQAAPASIVLRAGFSPFSCCRGVQAALKRSYHSDSLTRV